MEKTHSAEQQQNQVAEGDMVALLEAIVERLDRMEERLGLSAVKESYTTEEVAKRMPGKRSNWTVRQWCCLGQAKAKKVRGKGRKGEWRIAHDELVRLQNEGPSPLGTFQNHGHLSGRLG